VIDPEFAFYGPMGFDIGAIIGMVSFSGKNVRCENSKEFDIEDF
jgi:5-methylthioribose kinase